MNRDNVRWRHYPGFLAFKALCGLVRMLPEKSAERLFDGASFLACHLDRRHRKVALANLDLAFGESKTVEEKKKILREAFQSLFFTAAEFVRLPRVIGDIESRIRVVPDDGPVARALARGKGVIYLVSHIGNWELLAHRGLYISQWRLASVARPLRNPLIYGEIERLRCINGAVVLKKKQVIREIIERLRRNWCVAILMDQYAGRKSPFVPFFGRPVSTIPVVARLAVKTGAAVVPVFSVRRRFGLLDLCVCEEVPVSNSGDREADIIENCTRFNRVIEEWVRRYPGHWLWMHRRWRRKKAAGEP